MPLKIAITGALGLLGSGITTAALSSGHSVLALDIREDGEMLNGFGETTQEDIDIRQRAIDAVKDKEGQFTYKKVDLMDYERTKEVIREAGCDALIHLAAVYAKKDADGNYLAGPGQEVSLAATMCMSGTDHKWTTSVYVCAFESDMFADDT